MLDFCLSTQLMTNMSVTLLYLSVLLHSGLSVVVLQSEDQVFQPGDPATLQCRMGPGLSMNSYTMFWYRQNHNGAPLEFLTREYDRNQSRVSIMSPALTIVLLLIELTSKVESVTFQQSPSQIVSKGTKELEINCSYDDSSLQVMLWYQHIQSNRSLSLIGYIVALGDPVYDDQFKNRVRMKREDTLRGSLIIPTVDPSLAAVYYCAASTQ